ncbi:MAG: hypothetical protein A2X23_02650 [Chloroflexi bacterium GWC2_73_18]|nr:MAG: hypothetical protein A2X23_02650 [Chloroflexi bacterium GWC2_73_18]
MITWRRAVFTGLIFVALGIVYGLLTAGAGRPEMAGATMLAVLGVAIGVTFALVLRGSGEL